MGWIRGQRACALTSPLDEQLHAIERWTAAGREPHPRERARIQIGVLAARELEPAEDPATAELSQRLQYLDLYFGVWPPEGVAPEDLGDDEILERLRGPDDDAGEG